jgi:hypothetical protein
MRRYGRPDAGPVQDASPSSRAIRHDAQNTVSAALHFVSSPGTKASRLQTAPAIHASSKQGLSTNFKTQKRDIGTRLQRYQCDRNFEALQTQQLSANMSQSNKFLGQPRRHSPSHQQQGRQSATFAVAGNRNVQSIALFDAVDAGRQVQAPSFPVQQQPHAFKTQARPLATIHLTRDFATPEQRLHMPAAIRQSVIFATPQHAPYLVPMPAYTRPSAAVASSLSVSEISFLSPEAAAEATHARNEYMRRSTPLHPLPRRSAARARPLSVPESSPR